MTDRIVYESPADEAGFTMFSNVVLLDETLSVQARMTYALLCHYSRQSGSCFPGKATLGAKLGGVSERSVFNYIDELVAAMLIRREQRGIGRTCNYVILALGLRAKRMAEASSATGFRRQAVSVGNPLPTGVGNQLPAEVDAEEGNADGVSARARRVPRYVGPKFNGKPVQAVPWAMTERILPVLNAKTGQKYRLLTSAGQPSEAAKRIYGRVLIYPDIGFEKYVDIIERTVASRWWDKGKQGAGGDATVGVVFGKEVFEDNIRRKGVPTATMTPAQEAAEAKRVRQEKRMAIIRGEDAA